MKKLLLIGAAALFGVFAVTAAVAADHQSAGKRDRHSTRPAAVMASGGKVQKVAPARRHSPAVRKHSKQVHRIHRAR